LPFDFRFINFPPKIAIILKNINPWKEEMGMYDYFSFRFKNDFLCSQNFKLFNFSLIFYLKLIFFFRFSDRLSIVFFSKRQPFSRTILFVQKPISTEDNPTQDAHLYWKQPYPRCPSLLKATLPKMPISTEDNPTQDAHLYWRQPYPRCQSLLKATLSQ